MEVQGKERTSDQVANATFKTSVKDVKAFRKEIDDNVDKMEHSFITNLRIFRRWDFLTLTRAVYAEPRLNKYDVIQSTKVILQRRGGGFMTKCMERAPEVFLHQWNMEKSPYDLYSVSVT